MKNLIPLYRFERLYTLFYDEKDGKIYKISQRKTFSFGKLITMFMAVLALSYFGEIYIVHDNLTISFIILFLSYLATYFLIHLYNRWYYKMETKNTSYLYEDQVKKRAEEGLKQWRNELVLTIISSLVTLFFAYLFMKNAQIGILFSTSGLFGVTLLFIRTKPCMRHKLLKEMNFKNK